MEATCFTESNNKEYLSYTASYSAPPFYPIHEIKKISLPREKELEETESVYRVYKAMIIGIGLIDTGKNINLSNHAYRLKTDSVYIHIHDLIFKNVLMPEDWAEQGINPPNVEAKQVAQRICVSLYNDYGLIPIRINPTKEEGIFISYRNFNNNRDLIVEVYNNLEVAALVNDSANKRILYSEDIKGFNFVFVLEKLIAN